MYWFLPSYPQTARQAPTTSINNIHIPFSQRERDLQRNAPDMNSHPLVAVANREARLGAALVMCVADDLLRLIEQLGEGAPRLHMLDTFGVTPTAHRLLKSFAHVRGSCSGGLCYQNMMCCTAVEIEIPW
jgi:hypothetical protein